MRAYYIFVWFLGAIFVDFFVDQMWSNCWSNLTLFYGRGRLSKIPKYFLIISISQSCTKMLLEMCCKSIFLLSFEKQIIDKSHDLNMTTFWNLPPNLQSNPHIAKSALICQNLYLTTKICLKVQFKDRNTSEMKMFQIFLNFV